MSTSTFFFAKVSVIVGVLIGISYACTSGYTADHGTCYKFYSTSKNWDTARKLCQQTGGDLAQIETTQEAANVKALRISTGKANTYYWIGGRQQPRASSPFQWLNGNSVNDQLWHTGEPNNARGSAVQCMDLGVAAQQHKMNDYSCSESLPFMCEKKCPTGWYDSQFGTCYKFVSTTSSWFNARTSCQQLGGDLAVIDTPAKVEEMALLRKNSGLESTYYWVGAIQNTNAKGAFMWVNRARFYHGLWKSGEPNQVNFSNRQCVDLGVDAQSNRMNDYPCSSSLAYICEKSVSD